MTKLTTTEVDQRLSTYYELKVGNGPRYIRAFEVRNRAGFSATRTADLVVLDTWESGPVRLIGHEVKVSRSDWVRELKQPDKAQAFIPYVAEWWLAVADPTIVHDGELPEGWGLMAVSGATMRTIVRAARKPQPPIMPGMLAGFTRALDRTHQGELARQRRIPFDRGDVPMAPVYDNVGPEGWPARHGEIQRPSWDLR